MTTLINLFMKPVILEDPSGSVTFPAAQTPAKVQRGSRTTDMVLVEGKKVFINEESVNGIIGVPPEQDGTLYIVPAVVAAAVYSEDPDRDDLVVPMGGGRTRGAGSEDSIRCSRLSKPL